MRKYPFCLLLLTAALAGCGQPDAPAAAVVAFAPVESTLPSGRIASRMADRLPAIHLNRDAFTSSVATNALMLFIESLDYHRSFFLDADNEELQNQS